VSLFRKRIHRPRLRIEQDEKSSFRPLCGKCQGPVKGRAKRGAKRAGIRVSAVETPGVDGFDFLMTPDKSTEIEPIHPRLGVLPRASETRLLTPIRVEGGDVLGAPGKE